MSKMMKYLVCRSFKQTYNIYICISITCMKSYLHARGARLRSSNEEDVRDAILCMSRRDCGWQQVWCEHSLAIAYFLICACLTIIVEESCMC